MSAYVFTLIAASFNRMLMFCCEWCSFFGIAKKYFFLADRVTTVEEAMSAWEAASPPHLKAVNADEVRMVDFNAELFQKFNGIKQYYNFSFSSAEPWTAAMGVNCT